MESRTARLNLHAIDEFEARRIHDRVPQSGDAWTARLPVRRGPGCHRQPSAHYRAERRAASVRLLPDWRQSDGVAIGGVGFKGPPYGGVVEIGYGLVPSARGHGYATEALATLVKIAAGLGMTTIRADTDLDNVASQRTLEHAGFYQVEADSELCYYEAQVQTV